MQMILDCENLETSVNSVCSIFRCSEKSLREILLEIDINKTYDIDEPDCTPDYFLYRNMVSAFGEPHQLQYIYWFHLTRTFHTNNFHEGILPLGMALDSIWEMILSIFRQSEHCTRLQTMRIEGVYNNHYQTKTRDPFHWGPFAMLVKEVAFVPNRLANHNYLWLPEIVEDICNGYLEKYKVSIHEDVCDALVPCIVKFMVRGSSGIGNVAPAIYYVYKGIRGEPVSYYANTCFDAGGKVIPRSDILKIEYIEKP